MVRPVRSSLWLGLYASLLTVVLLQYFAQYPLPEFGAKCSATLSLLFLMGSLYYAGKRILSYFAAPANDVWPILFSTGLGMGFLGTVVLLTGWLLPGPLTSKFNFLLIFFAVIQIKGIHSDLPRLKSFWHSRMEEKWSSVEIVCVVLIALGMILSLVTAFSPITYYDSLVYHLALPSLYNREGMIHAVSYNLYSFFPANVEMLFLFILNRFPEPEYVINLLSWSVTVGIGVGLYAWMKSSFNRKAGLFTMALWWTTPAVLLLSVGGYIEIFLAFYILLAVRSFLLALEGKSTSGWLSVSGLFGGFAAATKYTGAITPIIIGCYLTWLLFSKRLRFKQLLIYCLCAFLPMAPWLLKNALAIGNPFFPFFYSWFGGNVGWTGQTAAGYFQVLTEYGAKSNLLLQLFLAPWNMSVNAQQFGGGFDVLGDYGWPLFIFGTPIGICFGLREKSTRPLIFYFVAHYLIWFLTKPVLRFFVGALPVAVLLTGMGLIQVFSKNFIHRLIAIPMVACFLISNFFLYLFIADGFRPFTVPFGFMERESYLQQRLSFYPTYQFVNSTLTPSDRVLLLGEQRTYHLAIPYLCANIFAPSPLSAICNQASSLEEIRKEVEKLKVTHFLVNKPEIDRLGGLPNFGFEARGEGNLHKFLSQGCAVVKSEGGVDLYRVN